MPSNITQLMIVYKYCHFPDFSHYEMMQVKLSLQKRFPGTAGAFIEDILCYTKAIYPKLLKNDRLIKALQLPEIKQLINSLPANDSHQKGAELEQALKKFFSELNDQSSELKRATQCSQDTIDAYLKSLPITATETLANQKSALFMQRFRFYCRLNPSYVMALANSHSLFAGNETLLQQIANTPEQNISLIFEQPAFEKQLLKLSNENLEMLTIFVHSHLGQFYLLKQRKYSELDSKTEVDQKTASNFRHLAKITSWCQKLKQSNSSIGKELI
ncbi:MAG: hypothetical protein ACK4M7_06450, partial [Burkholderiales bacterium]